MATINAINGTAFTAINAIDGVATSGLTAVNGQMITGGINAPTDIAGCIAWWDFSDISVLFQNNTGTTPITTNGQTIKFVNDKSTANRDLSDMADAGGTTYVTGAQNGKSVGSFDGIRSLNFTTSSITAVSVFIVYKVSAQESEGGPLNWRTAAEAGFQINGDTTDYQPHLTVVNAAGTETVNQKSGTTYTLPMSSFILLEFESTPAGWINAGSISLSSGDSGYSSTGGRVGSAWHLVTAQIGEIVVYDNVISTGDRQLLETWFNNKWAIY